MTASSPRIAEAAEESPGQRASPTSPAATLPAEPPSAEARGFYAPTVFDGQQALECRARVLMPATAALPSFSTTRGVPQQHLRNERSLHQDRVAEAQCIFDHFQAELLLQSRRQDDVFNSISKVEADLSRVASLAAESEGLHATERRQRIATLATLARRTEDAMLACQSLRITQERLSHKVERLEVKAEDADRAVEEASRLQHEVMALQDAARMKLDVYGQALQRLNAMERVEEENARLREEVAHLRVASERRDLEMAAVQGQLDALTKLVKEQLRDSPSSAPRSEWSPSPG